MERQLGLEKELGQGERIVEGIDGCCTADSWDSMCGGTGDKRICLLRILGGIYSGMHVFLWSIVGPGLVPKGICMRYQ